MTMSDYLDIEVVGYFHLVTGGLSSSIKSMGERIVETLVRGKIAAKIRILLEHILFDDLDLGHLPVTELLHILLFSELVAHLEVALEVHALPLTDGACVDLPLW